MTLEELQRLNELERRLARLESILDSQTKSEAPAVAPLPPAAPSPPPRAVLPPPTRSVPPMTPTRSVVPIIPVAHAEEKNSSFEKQVGLKWAGRAGALALAASIAMGVKFAYENGWFNQIPPGARVLFTAFAGFTLIGLGEWVYRAVNRHAAAGLFGAGVAALFIAAYAGNVYYGLYPAATAFWLAGIATLIGAGLSMRGNLAAVAALSLLGGMLAPVILSTGQKPGISLLAYALSLQLLALFLAWWGNSTRWWALRVIALFSTSLWFGVVIESGEVTKPVMLAALLFAAALFQAELVASAVRSSLRVTPETEFVRTLGDTSAATFSIIVTFMFSVAGMWALSERYDCALWALALAMFFALQAFVLPRMLGAAVRPLSMSFQAQSALLAMVAVPLVFDSAHSITFAWALMAVAFAFLASEQKSALPLIFTAMGLVAASGVWAFNGLISADDLKKWVPLINGFSAAGALLILSHAASALLVDRLDRENKPRKYQSVSAFLWCLTLPIFLYDGTLEIHNWFHMGGLSWFNIPAAEQVALSVFWALSAIALVVLGFVLSKPAVRIAGLAFFGFTLVKVVLIDGSYLSSGFRVLSFLGVGALLIITSVLYGKFKKE